MKKSFKVVNLDCAVCASKMEALVNKIEEVNSCTISFMTCKMVVEAEEFNDELMKKITKAVKKVDSCCEVI